MKRLTEKRDGQNVIPLRQNGKIKWSICSAGLGDAPTKYLYGDHADRLAAIEDILGDKYDLNRLRELAEADRMIGKEVWAQAKYLNVFQTKSSFIQRKTIQYVSLLKGKDILCHTQTCAFPLNEIGKTIFLTYEEAMAALRREQE